MQRGFGELRRMAHEHGFEVLVVVWPDLMQFEDYAHAGAHLRAHSHAMEAGFDLIDLYYPLRDATGGDPTSIRFHDGHPNEAGHALAARIVADHFAPDA